MDKKEFFEKIDKLSSKIEIKLSEEQKDQFFNYMELLIDWNEKINLTAIIEPNEIILKHFIDSISISKYIEKNAYVADIGTGAGFPGIPLKIVRNDIKIVLVDSLNKRIKFLDEVIEKIGLTNIETIHKRAEEFGNDKNYREKFDVVTSRAVANLATLSEYLLPLTKVNGKCLSMKGPGANEEINDAKNAIKVFGGTISNVFEFKLPDSDINRTVIEIKKVKNTPSKYPRKAGIPAKEPVK